MFWCPGCNEPHGINVGEGPGPRWGYSGNVDAPTFTPSIKVTDGQGACCHSFVTDGRIKYLADCTHALAGQTVPLGDWEWEP